jgi:putative endonuclease
MHFVYILKSKVKNWIYVGSTNDIKRRFGEHERGEVQSTRPYRPFDLVFYEGFLARNDAVRREDYLKTTKGKSTLRMMLRESLQITPETEITS